ncbi:Transcriptional regulator, LacI family (fragment) [Shewanella benthica]|uniref:Transcriptional regulator, LacI family n=1 Tax=Shewanella benthica TaxID=43661 RepID=A0A330M0R5_9GAMM
MDYQPNLAARNLAETKSYVIGFIYDNPNAYYVIDMQNGIRSSCKGLGYELLIHPCNAKSDNIFHELTTMVKHARLAGLAVLVNDKHGAVSITQHLIDLGHKNIAFLSGVQHHESTKARLSGYTQALLDNNLEVDKQNMIEGEYSFESGVSGAKT